MARKGKAGAFSRQKTEILINRAMLGQQQGQLNSLTLDPSDITGLVEFIQDTVAAYAVGGANITITYDDAANTLTWDAVNVVTSNDNFTFLNGDNFTFLNGDSLTFL